MPLFNCQTRWRGIVTTVAVELIVLIAIALAVVRYVEWSSDVALAEFMSPPKPSASDPNHAGEFSTPIQSNKGRAACDRKG
jgi:hypothetical protein